MEITRRGFVKLCAVGAAVAAGSRFFQPADSVQYDSSLLEYVRSTCSPNCTGACGF